MYTDDTFLGSRVTMRQPVDGFRSGLDAVMLAAAVPAGPGSRLLELGCGAGAASLCVSHRVPDCIITGVDIDDSLVALARENARANSSCARIVFEMADVLALPQELKRDFDHVFSNPPFHDSAEGEAPANAERARAKHDEGRFGAWLSAAMKRVASSGTLTLIQRADRLDETLSVLPGRGLSIFPLWPRTDAPAKRIVLQWRKSSRAALCILPGLVLHEKDGSYTSDALAILRDGASLALDRRRL